MWRIHRIAINDYVTKQTDSRKNYYIVHINKTHRVPVTIFEDQLNSLFDQTICKVFLTEYDSRHSTCQ